MAREEVDRLEADETRLARGAQGAPPAARSRTTTATSSSRSGPAPAARRRRCSPASCCGCTCATPTRTRFTAEVLHLNETGIGGVKEAIVEIDGDGAYSRLKFEGGVHRVQRVPVDRVVRADPHVDGDGRRDARGRRGRDRRSTRSGTSGSTSSARRARAASRSTRPTRPCGSPTCRPASSSRSRTRRASTRTRPRRWRSCARGCYDLELQQAAGGRLGGAPVDGRAGGPLGEDPDLQLPAGPGHRPPDRADRPRPAGRCSQGEIDPLIDALIMADQADRLDPDRDASGR